MIEEVEHFFIRQPMLVYLILIRDPIKALEVNTNIVKYFKAYWINFMSATCEWAFGRQRIRAA